MTTLLAVARRAGVSKSTVSNVIHGKVMVDGATREKVEKAIDEIRYRPNAIARSLRARSSRVIGMIVSDLSNPFHAQLSVAVESAAKRLGYAALITLTECKPEAELETERALFERRVDGVVISGLSVGSKLPIELLDRGIPVVLASLGDLSDPRLGVVDHDDFTAMEAVVTHLFSLGHRRMNFVSQTHLEQSGERRIRGFEQALEKRGLRPASFDEATAHVAHNDVLAIETMDQLERRGRKVPEQASVVGYDDIPLAAHSRIQLTTVRSDARRLGARAVELVVAAAQANSHVKKREIQLNPLIVRHTTGPAPC